MKTSQTNLKTSQTKLFPGIRRAVFGFAFLFGLQVTACGAPDAVVEPAAMNVSPTSAASVSPLGETNRDLPVETPSTEHGSCEVGYNGCNVECGNGSRFCTTLTCGQCTNWGIGKCSSRGGLRHAWWSPSC